MTKEELIKSAGKLKPVSNTTIDELVQKQGILTSEMNAAMSARTDVAKLIGKDNLDMMKNNHQNHALYMQTAMQYFDPQNFVETILWVYRAYRAHGFTLAYWPAQLRVWLEIFDTHLSEQSISEIRPFYEWMLTNQPAFVELSETDGK